MIFKAKVNGGEHDYRFLKRFALFPHWHRFFNNEAQTHYTRCIWLSFYYVKQVHDGDTSNQWHDRGIFYTIEDFNIEANKLREDLTYLELSGTPYPAYFSWLQVARKKPAIHRIRKPAKPVPKVVAATAQADTVELEEE